MTHMSVFRIYRYCRIYSVMNESSQDQTCLRVTKVTRNRLAKLGTKDETFEQIVRGLVDKENQSSGGS